jgi:glycosyltransferase involved in cell wall biosynthesis
MHDAPEPSPAAPPAAARALRLAIVTNIPAPYRVPVYNRIAAMPGLVLRLLYAARTEADRQWDLPPFEHEHVFLRGTVFARGGRFIHLNLDVWRELRRFDPDVVVTTGYNPTHLLACLFAWLERRQHVVMTDGTDASEARLSFLHRGVRRAVFALSGSFVVASQGGWRLLRSYGVPEAKIHCSPLCANTAVCWEPDSPPARDIDLLLSGRLVEVKNLAFALRVAQGTARRLGRRVRVAVLGSGPLSAGLRRQAATMAGEVEVQFAGHVAQAEMPGWYLRSRLFLFPTLWDPWGVVANEACQAGVPVLVSPHAGVAGELVRDGVNGWVLPLEPERWIAAAAQILDDADLQARLAAGARASIAPYSFDYAAFGIVDAARQALAAAPLQPRLGPSRRRA